MIQKLALSGLILFGISSSTNAEITISSGEHPGYTRLVLNFDDEPDWSVSRSPGKAVISFDPFDPEIQIDRIFSRIPKFRLENVKVDNNSSSLILFLNCICHIETWMARSQSLVIDIKDADSRNIFSNDVLAMTEGPILLLSSVNTDQSTTNLNDQLPISATTELQQLPPLLPFPSSSTASDVPLTEALAEELARAAAEGLVEIGAIRSGHSAEEQNVERLASPENMHIRNGSKVESTRNPAVTTLCPNSTLFDVRAWFTEQSPYVELSALRRNLVGEFDMVHREAALSLARYYVALGFGWEARAVLSEFLSDDPDTPSILALSYLTESGRGTGALAAYGECGGSLPLWALLDSDGSLADRTVDTNAALLAFANLPEHLRLSIGPRLVERLASRGEPSKAETVRASIARITNEGDPIQILTNTTDLHNQSASSDLEELALSSRPEAVVALVASLEKRLNSSAQIPQDLIDSAEAISFELKGSEEGVTLKSSEIRARIRNGDFSTAFLQLSSESTELSDNQLQKIWREGADALISTTEESVFLTHVFDEPLNSALNELKSEQRQDISRRLLDLGFPDQSERISAGSPDLRGQIQIAKGQLESALESIQDNRVLGQILEQMSRHEDARIVFEGLGDEDAQSDAAWRAKNWTEAQSTKSDLRRRASQEMLAITPERPPPDTIKGSETLLETSSRLRDTLSELLAAEELVP